MKMNRPNGLSIKEASHPLRIPTFFLTALAIGSLTLSACSSGKASQATPRSGAKSEVAPVVTGVVSQKDVPLELRVIGAVEPYSVVAVKSQVGGELTEVHFTEGQFVKKGETLFTIDPRPFEAALSQAEANLAKSTAQEKQAEANLARDEAQYKTASTQAGRYSSLLDSGVVSRDQYDQIRTNSDSLAESVKADKANVETARKAIEADKAAVQSARLQLSYTTIRSPIDGRTGTLVVHQGNLVKAEDTTPLVVINQVSPIRVTFSAPERQLSEIRNYMAKSKLKARVSQSNNSTHPEIGEVDFVDNAVDNTTGTIKLKATFANKERWLWPGQFANVMLTLTTRAGATVAPTQSIQTGQEGQYVFAVKPDQTVEMRPVVVAYTVGDDTVIDKGLKPGEVVVTDGQLRLVPGGKVKIRNREANQKPVAMIQTEGQMGAQPAAQPGKGGSE
ncbi:MAG: efflux RND transporter periplasmic adaptor subunit [Chloracidobacterium sp.]|nr:efflux RND transporter periplasmic adaptor subunit [Chloracidobacterium sp.]